MSIVRYMLNIVRITKAESGVKDGDYTYAIVVKELDNMH